MSGFVIRNKTDVLNSLNKNVDQIEAAAQFALGMTGLALERQAKLNANTGVHRRGTPRIAGTGPGPNRITGALMGSIQTKLVQGFGNYVAIVGPTVEYARAVELGSPRWKSGVKYPYLFPAAEKLSADGTLNRVFITNFRMKLGV